MKLTNTASTLLELLPLAAGSSASASERDVASASPGTEWLLISLGSLLVMAAVTMLLVKVSRDLAHDANK